MWSYAAASSKLTVDRFPRFHLASDDAGQGKNDESLDFERIPYAIDRSYPARIWTDGKPAGTTAVINGKVTLQLSPKGLTAIAVDELPVFRRLHADYFDGNQQPAAADKGFRTEPDAGRQRDRDVPVLRRPSRVLWTSASDSDVRAARLTFTDGQAERTLSDERHPFEFSVPVGERATIDYHLQFVRTDGTLVDADRHSLVR